MARQYATNPELYKVAQYYMTRNLKPEEVRAELLKSQYIVNISGVTKNVDYKLVEAMMYALYAVKASSKPARTRKAKLSQPPLMP